MLYGHKRHLSYGRINRSATTHIFCAIKSSIADNSLIIYVGVFIYSIYNDPTSDEYLLPCLAELQFDPNDDEECQIKLLKDSSDYATSIASSKDVKQICVMSQPYQVYDTFAYRHGDNDGIDSVV